ncbi:MAG TPA: L-lactate dehydrogenase [Intrasporangium sp.]|uniref:L-lactate dehydrogenase n=1 Tax=Intrasporangium sp. TaxID=1925024 RepID=UPI002D79904F|nr:L-lactate dehydrogenase [Intrasporangium sp.]HET7398849.1 L-lactate dehydrogenase [Intrasporangium sp.]
MVPDPVSPSAPATASEPPARRTHPSKVAIVGAGAVGATLAYATLIKGAAREVVLYDVNRAKVDAEVLDIGHGIEFMPMGSISGSDDIGICAGADIVVVTAGAKQRPGQSRMDLAEATINLTKTLVPRLVDVAPEAIHLMVTNPVDVVTHVALKLSGLPSHQLFGSGTVLDSSRLRWLIALRTGVAVHNVHAYMVGEHGDTEFPLWSASSIASIPLLDWPQTGANKLDATDREEIARDVVGAAYKIIEGKGATNYAVALAGARIIEAILRDEHRVLPVSSLLTDYAGISDVCLSVPSIVGSEGVRSTLHVPMNDEEAALLRASAERIRSVAAAFGF